MNIIAHVSDKSIFDDLCILGYKKSYTENINILTFHLVSNI